MGETSPPTWMNELIRKPERKNTWNHLDPISLGEGTQRSSSRTESMPEKMPAFGWENMLVSRWVTTYMAFHGFFLGAGSARHHKEPFFFFESEIYLSCEVWKAVVHFFWSSLRTLRGLAPNLRWNVMPNQKDSVWSVGSSYEINWDGRPVKNRKIQFGKKNTVKIVFQKCGSGLRSWSSWSSWACALRGAIEIEETLKVTKGPGRASGVFPCLKKHLGPVKLP